jgi:hypothetical protein
MEIKKEVLDELIKDYKKPATPGDEPLGRSRGTGLVEGRPA